MRASVGFAKEKHSRGVTLATTRGVLHGGTDAFLFEKKGHSDARLPVCELRLSSDALGALGLGRSPK
jgi:hypothetical protein